MEKGQVKKMKKKKSDGKTTTMNLSTLSSTVSF